MLILGNKYKLLDEDIEKIKRKFPTYYQIDIDENTEERLKNLISNESNVTTVVLNIDKSLPANLKDYLDDLQYDNKIRVLIFSDFVKQYLGQCQLNINEENILALLELQNNLGKKLGKRIFDILFSTFAITISSPVMLAIAILIKLKSPDGSVFFTQKRLGYAGKKFRVIKFRTMVPNAEEVLEKMLSGNKEIRNEYLKYRKLKNDPRIIPIIGEFLRKTSLDELPQFFNVLIGDMSVVGPRPYIEEEFYKHTKIHVDIITSVKPGVTGYWQVTDRNAATFNGRVDSDIEYIKNQNLWLDLKIIFQTVMVVVFKKGA